LPSQPYEWHRPNLKAHHKNLAITACLPSQQRHTYSPEFACNLPECTRDCQCFRAFVVKRVLPIHPHLLPIRARSRLQGWSRCHRNTATSTLEEHLPFSTKVVIISPHPWGQARRPTYESSCRRTPATRPSFLGQRRGGYWVIECGWRTWPTCSGGRFGHIRMSNAAEARGRRTWLTSCDWWRQLRLWKSRSLRKCGKNLNRNARNNRIRHTVKPRKPSRFGAAPSPYPHLSWLSIFLRLCVSYPPVPQRRSFRGRGETANSSDDGADMDLLR